MEILLDLCLGLTLSAACGFRIFIPPLVLSIASVYGHIQLSPEFQWAGTPTAVIVLLIATIIEILAYYIPVVDHFLDLINIPIVFGIGTLLTANALGNDIDPILQWSLAVIAGGSTATAIDAIASAGRLTSTATTLGIGNFVITTVEAILALILSVIGVISPIVALTILVLVLLLIGFLFWKFFYKKPIRQYDPPQ